MSGQPASRIYDIYKNSVIPHVCYIYKTSSGMYISTLRDFTSDKHALTHWKYLLGSCSKYTILVTPNQELNNKTQTMCPKIQFYV